MYQRLIRDYPGESALANLSRQNLSVLGRSGVAGGVRASAEPAAPTEVLLTDEEMRETARLRILLERSPDLLDAVMPGAANKMTGLQNAAAHGWTHVVDFLITTKAMRDAGGESGYPPLHLAAFYGHKAVAEQLIRAGTAPNLVTRDGLTPLHLAAYSGRRKIVEWLLQKGADPDRRLMGSPDLSSLDLRVVIGSGVTALGLAVLNGHEEVVELLLKAKADPNVGVPYYNLPIQHAVGIGAEGIIEKLFRAGVDPKATYSVSLYETAMRSLTWAMMLRLRSGSDSLSPFLFHSTPKSPASC